MTMKFGGFTTKGIIQARMRSFRQQFVFAEDCRVRKPRDEIIIHFRGNLWDVENSTLVQQYYRGISTEKQVGMAKSLWPTFRFEYTLNENELRDLIAESMDHINPEGNYEGLRWHDVVVLLLVAELFEANTELGNYAQRNLSAILKKDADIKKYVEKYLL